ncbi:hypothetical protein KJ909_03415 [Patescibacteria group bacterium]|nr:hypothetical protein [Patescibacteria group bacterium]
MDPNNHLLAEKYIIEPVVPLPPGVDSVSQIENTLSTVIGFLTIVAFIYFTIQIILAGYSFLSSNGDKDKLKNARQSLTNNVIGLAIIVVAVGLTSLMAQLLGLGNIFDLNLVFKNITKSINH